MPTAIPSNSSKQLMQTATLLRRVPLALAALTLACGDSTAPRLSEAQVFDMLDAMSVVADVSELPGSPALRASLVAAPPTTANATVSVSQTVSCPNGGTASVSGTATEDEQAGTASAQVTHSFTGCAATSSEGRVWTFNGNPNILTTFSATHNATTGAFSMTVTQMGGVRFASDLGEGACQINLTVTLSGDDDSLSSSIVGSACGRTIQQSVEITP
jgi:hypothetical protein